MNVNNNLKARKRELWILHKFKILISFILIIVSILEQNH